MPRKKGLNAKDYAFTPPSKPPKQPKRKYQNIKLLDSSSSASDIASPMTPVPAKRRKVTKVTYSSSEGSPSTPVSSNSSQADHLSNQANQFSRATSNNANLRSRAASSSHANQFSRATSSSQRVPAASSSQRVPAASSSQRVPAASSSQRVPAASSSQCSSAINQADLSLNVSPQLNGSRNVEFRPEISPNHFNDYRPLTRNRDLTPPIENSPARNRPALSPNNSIRSRRSASYSILQDSNRHVHVEENDNVDVNNNVDINNVNANINRDQIDDSFDDREFEPDIDEQQVWGNLFFNREDKYQKDAIAETVEDPYSSREKVLNKGFTEYKPDVGLVIRDDKWNADIIGKRPVFKATHEGLKAVIGYDEYHFHNGNFTRKGLVYMRCSKRKKLKCDAGIYLNKEGCVIKASGCHKSHAEERMRVLHWRALKSTTLNSPLLLIQDIIKIVNTQELCSVALRPKEDTARKAIYRFRKALIPICPKDVFEITLEGTMFHKMRLFEREIMVGDERHKFIGVGSRLGLRILKNSDEWACDGTFSSASQHFQQLYIIHGKISPNQNVNVNSASDREIRERNLLKPCIYIFSTSKSQIVYTAILKEIKNCIEEMDRDFYEGPQRVIMDFERAVFNAFGTVFPRAMIQYCFFHFSQTVMRKCKENHDLAVLIRNKETRGWEIFRKLQSVAFLPAADIPRALMELRRDPSMRLGLDVIRHLQRFYVGTAQRPPLFAPLNWSCYAANANLGNRTSNNCEAFNSKFNKMLKNVHNFFSIIHRIEMCIIEMEDQHEMAVSGLFARNLDKNERYRKMIKAHRALKVFLEQEERLYERLRVMYNKFALLDFADHVINNNDDNN